MTDTVNIRIASKAQIQTGQLEIIAEGRRYNKIQKEYKYKNIRIKVVNNDIYIDGSLSKLLLGCNTTSLDRIQTKFAVQLIESVIGIDLRHARLSRIDFAATLQVSKKVNSYYQLLGHKSRHCRDLVTKNTLNYKSNSSVLAFYDKGKQAQIDNHKLMRIEARWKENAIKRFTKELVGDSILTVDNFLELEIFSFLIEQWHREYVNIQKVDVITFDIEKITSPKEVIGQLALLGIEASGGLDQLLTLLKNDIGNVSKHKNFFPRIKEMLLSIDSGKRLITENHLITELDELVSSHAEHCLSMNRASGNSLI